VIEMNMNQNECPLGLRADVGISSEQLHSIQKLETLELPFLWHKLVEDGVLIEAEIPVVELELKRFMALVAIGIQPLAMIGPTIDAAWHQFVLFTAQYRGFCQTVFRKFIDHQPNTPATPVPAIAWKNFCDGYRRHFGELPEIWLRGLDQDAIRLTLGTGSVMPTKWSGWIDGSQSQATSE
jgi:hypothetical protein